MQCEFCSTQFKPIIEIESRFCSDECRHNWHNEYRRLDRLEKRAKQAIDDLVAIMDAKSTNNFSAYSAIQSIRRLIEDNNRLVTIECGHCGQLAMIDNVVDNSCSFCGKSDWRKLIE